jgi:archaemetzincin
MLFEIYLFKVEDYLVDVVKRLLEYFQDSRYFFRNLDSVPDKCFYEPRKQYRGDYINRWLNEVREEEDSIVIGLLNIDAYVPPLNFVFGVASPYYNVCSVYLPRLSFGVDTKIIEERVFKEVLHELGHIFGMKHCDNKRCVMAFSNSIIEVDQKTGRLCSKHFNIFAKRNIIVSDNLLLRE